MKTLQRFDYAEIKATKTDEGFLVDTPVVGRVGIQEYKNADGSTRRELRLPEDVFHKDSLASFAAKPITVDHPTGGKVTSKTAHRVTVGTVLQDGMPDGETVRAKIVIHSPDAIGERRQLSLGYKCITDEIPGEHAVYGPYDAIQRIIRINHLSVVKSARAGAIARLNIDSNEEIDVQPKEHPKMPRIKLDSGLEYECLPEVEAEFVKLRADATGGATKFKALELTVVKTEAERDALKARVDAFPTELAKAKADAKTDAARRASLEVVAASFKVDCKDKTDREVKVAVVKSVRKDFDDKEKTDAYIDASFDFAVETKADAAMAGQRQSAHSTETAGGYKSASQRYADNMDALSAPKEVEK